MRVLGLLVVLLISLLGQDARAAPQYAIAMYGSPALGPEFTDFPYANENAPKGGTIVFGVMGTFDTLNPYSVRGIAAQGIAPPMGLVIQSLMVRSADEPFTMYRSPKRSLSLIIAVK